MKTSLFLSTWRRLPIWAIGIVLAAGPAMARESSNRVASFAMPGPFSVESDDGVWHDAARERDIPVRILSPCPGAAATAAEKDMAYPVIIFSHGLGGSREGGALWGRHWASHGYIVVHLQHIGSDEAVWKDKKPHDAVGSMKRAMNLENSRLRIGDVKFALDEMARLRDAGAAPFKHADLARIGMSGHSFGAQTTLAVAGQLLLPLPGVAGTREARIVAAIAFSPNARVKIGLDRQFAGITLPFFSVTGTRDGSVLDDRTRYEDRLAPYEKMPAGDKYLASFVDGDHMVFGGHALGGRRPETTRDREIQNGVKAATLAFWDATLKRDASARDWLQRDFKSTLIAGDSFTFK